MRNIFDRLGEIRVPTIVMSGRYDEMRHALPRGAGLFVETMNRFLERLEEEL